MKSDIDYALQNTAVLILNWNGKHWLEKFLPSVTTHTSAKIVVIDNASTDNSIDFLQTKYNGKVDIISLEKNYGFSEGYNRGIQQITQEYIVLLNSDVEVTTGWLEKPLQLLIKSPKCAAVQPAIHAYQNKKRYDYAGAAGGYIDTLGFPYCRGRVFHDIEPINTEYKTAEVDWVCGAAMITRRQVYVAAGGLDARFFAHMEEIDLCMRYKRMGYTLICTPESVVYHVGGGTLSSQNAFKTFLNHRNNLLLIAKNLTPYKAIPLIFSRLCLDALAVFKYLINKSPSKSLAVIQSHFSFYWHIMSFYFWQNTKFKKLKTLTLVPKKRITLFKLLYSTK